MKISARQMKQLKDTPNSGYDKIKVEFLYHSNKIEGSTFTKENLEKYLDKRIIQGTHSVDDVYETINSTELFDFIVDTLDTPLTARLIQEYHQLLKQNTKDHERGSAGIWKKIPNTITGVGELDIAQPYEVSERIDELLTSWKNSNKSVDDIICFHADFEKIHPFQDGNGRIGRFLMLKQCIENDVDLISIDEKSNDIYKAALYKAQTQGSFTNLKSVIVDGQQELDKRLSFLEQVKPYLDNREKDEDELEL